MPKMPRTNARSARTAARLRDAALALAAVRDINDIDVQHISSQAELNRTTFYLHYPDRDALLRDVLGTVFKEITEASQLLFESGDPEALRTSADWNGTLFARIGERPELFRRLLGSGGHGFFQDELLRFYEEGFITLWQRLGYEEDPGGPSFRVAGRYAAAGLLGVIVQWLESGQPESPVLLSDWIWNMSFPRHPLGTPSGS